MPHGHIAGGVPADKQQRGAEPAEFVGVVGQEEADRIRMAIDATERGGTVMLAHVATEGHLGITRWGDAAS